MNGPFPAGENDLTIFRKENGLKSKIPSNKLLIADKRYISEYQISTQNDFDSADVKQYQQRVRARQESINARIHEVYDRSNGGVFLVAQDTKVTTQTKIIGMVGGQPIPRGESFVKEIRNASETPLQYKTNYWIFVGVNNWKSIFVLLLLFLSLLQ